MKAENLFLRKQLALFVERKAKPQRANDATRLTLVLLSRLFAWRDALVNVRPETLLRWHRKGFRLLWRWKSRPRGRPRLPANLRKLIVEMTQSNPTWGEECIAADLLLKLGIQVSPRTVRRYASLLKQMPPLTENIAALAKRCRQNRIPVIYVNDNRGKWRSDFSSVIGYCKRPGMPGSPFVAKLDPAARELLKDLSRRGVKWAIATGGDRETVQRMTKPLHIPAKTPVITGDHVEKAKPDPDVFLMAAQRLGMELTDCIVVGDSVWDILGARRAKAIGVGLLCGGYSAAELDQAGAYRVYKDPADLQRTWPKSAFGKPGINYGTTPSRRA